MFTSVLSRARPVVAFRSSVLATAGFQQRASLSTLFNNLSLTSKPVIRSTSQPNPLQPSYQPQLNASVFVSRRFAASQLRPRRTKYRKAHKGYFKTKSGGSLRGTRVYYGEYGLQAAEGGRIRDKQLDNVKACVRLVMKSEKGAKLILRAFPDRPVTAKGAETRMGKGKGTVDYYATWVSEGRILFEIRGLPETSALEAFRIASQSLPIRTRVVRLNRDSKVAPRVLPYFIRKRITDSARFEALKQREKTWTAAKELAKA